MRQHFLADRCPLGAAADASPTRLFIRSLARTFVSSRSLARSFACSLTRTLFCVCALAHVSVCLLDRGLARSFVCSVAAQAMLPCRCARSPNFILAQLYSLLPKFASRRILCCGSRNSCAPQLISSYGSCRSLRLVLEVMRRDVLVERMFLYTLRFLNHVCLTSFVSFVWVAII